MRQVVIDFEERQVETLRVVAERDGRTLTDLVVEAVGRYLEAAAGASRKGLAAISGIAHDLEARGRDHDRWLYGRADR